MFLNFSAWHLISVGARFLRQGDPSPVMHLTSTVAPLVDSAINSAFVYLDLSLRA